MAFSTLNCKVLLHICVRAWVFALNFYKDSVLFSTSILWNREMKLFLSNVNKKEFTVLPIPAFKKKKAFCVVIAVENRVAFNKVGIFLIKDIMSPRVIGANYKLDTYGSI